ncbi:MAG TPA: hypothetical protein VM760_05830 [Sphingomicrobium sp.]|jgi:hypothetical protein|nr:hypothetical protein [Sphingomicrobium sp.]
MSTDGRTDLNTDRKDWKAPELRSVVPLRRTAGGIGDLNDQDTVFYNAS